MRALSVPSLWIVLGRDTNVQNLARAFGYLSFFHKVAGFEVVLLVCAHLRYAPVSEYFFVLICTAHAIEGRELMVDNLQWMIMHWEFRFRLLWYFMYCL